MKVNKGDKIKIEYTGTLNDGKVFDTSEGRAPLKFEVGAGQVIPGFDKAVEEMELNEEKTFTIKSEEAYGPVREELVQDFPRDRLPEKPEPQEGMVLIMQAPTGQQVPGKITKVAEDKVTIDINHPLAGKDLTFKIKVVSINDPNDDDEECDCDDESCHDCGCGCDDGPLEDEDKNSEDETEGSPEDEDKEGGCPPSSCAGCSGCHH